MLLGVTPSEQIAIANIARYHRGPAPKKAHGNFGILSKPMRRRIKALSGILRVADGFDRGHASSVADVKVRWTSRALRITAVPQRASGDVKLELWGASRKAKLLSKAAGAPVEIVDPSGRAVSPS
jgi:exopolyphosphatase/guanosine-5'-triphosphate,3'-diphosphate pyrophosphatase